MITTVKIFLGAGANHFGRIDQKALNPAGGADRLVHEAILQDRHHRERQTVNGPERTDQRPDHCPEAALAADLALCERAVAGDRAAFEQIYRRHAARVHGLCLRLTGDRTEAEGLVQDTFVKAWFSLAGYAGQGHLGGWLGRVAVNLWRDRFRARNRGARLLERLAEEAAGDEAVRTAAAAPGAAAGGSVIPLLLAVDLERAVARLPQGGRTVYVLHDVEGYTHREIADLLGVAVGTVKAHLHRARRLLRTMLSEGREAAHGA
jgi:RNA polymerase sigma-70 factor (ECF subfamily)